VNCGCGHHDPLGTTDTGDGCVSGHDAVASELTPIATGDRAPRAGLIGELQAFLDDHPADAETWHRLGVALNAEGRYDEAAAAHHSALTLSPHNLRVECDYAYALAGRGEFAQASGILEEIIHRDPGNGWAYFHLATARYRQNACEQAATLWECAARCLDDPSDCFENLAMAYRRLGNSERERSCWQRLAAIKPDDPAVEHMLAAVGITASRPRASDAYVTELFDRFATDFDRVLGVLEYAVPELAETWIRAVYPTPEQSLRILDAGCGTGLCGLRLAPWAEHLTGVDLSPRMLARAAERGVYDEIIEQELVAYLEDHPGSFDVIVAGDVLCYFGDLGPFCETAFRALKPAGRLAFSVEAMNESERSERGYVMRAHGRYAHARPHTESALASSRQVTITETILRLEAGSPVHGFWIDAAAP
jgi:predicted TPR repeat methyltransferase